MSRARSDRGELMEALQGAMRRLSDGVNLYESAVAERLGMHPTDLHFLGLVQLYGPTTAGHLAELGALTTGAVTGVLDRLEQAGYVRREPDPDDRRRVVVRMVEDSMSSGRPAVRAAPRRVRHGVRALLRRRPRHDPRLRRPAPPAGAGAGLDVAGGHRASGPPRPRRGRRRGHGPFRHRSPG